MCTTAAGLTRAIRSSTAARSHTSRDTSAVAFVRCVPVAVTTGGPRLSQQLAAQIAARAGHQDARLRARVRRLHAPIVATLDVRPDPQLFTEIAMTTTLPGQDTDALLTRLGIDSSLLAAATSRCARPSRAR